MLDEIRSVPLCDIRSAQARLDAVVIRSPLLHCDAGPPDKDIFLKLENLQPTGSFKVRPIGNALLTRPLASLAAGLYTASSGNSALAVAWMARRLGVPATALVPDDAPEAKLRRLRSLGARIVELSFDEWWHAIETGGHPQQPGLYVDAVRDPAALAGDGTIGLEILEQAPLLEAILVPFGGGGLACGIACAVRALKPQMKIIACELASAQPLATARRAGAVVAAPCEAGFVSGVGYASILPEMWRLAGESIDATITVSLAQVASAIRIMAQENQVIAEGAGAVSVAAALFGQYPQRRVCAVVSGGNLGAGMLSTILAGAVPGSSH